MTKQQIDITVLGSGTCVPSLRRSSCAVLMKTGGANLLFDCGAGTMRRLLAAGIHVHEIDFVFLSHFHPDHSGELVSFLFSSKYPDVSARKRPLTLVGGTGFRMFFAGLEKVYGRWIDLEDRLKIEEMDSSGPDERRFNGFRVTTRPVVHNEESIACRVSAIGGPSVVYSGDTDFSEDLIQLARETDLLICESALPDEMNVDGHLTPSGAGEIAARAKARRLMLTHFYPECDSADIVAECRKTYDGPLFLAEDLMRLSIR